MPSRVRDDLVPEPPARWALLAAGATAGGVVAGLPLAAPVAVSGIPIAWRVPRWRVAVTTALLFFVAGSLSGLVADRRVEATRRSVVPDTVAEVTMRVAEDASTNLYGIAVGEIEGLDGVPWRGPRIAVRGLNSVADVGDTVVAKGSLTAGERRVRDEVVAGTFDVGSVSMVVPTANPLVRAGNLVRSRVQATFDGTHAGDGLIAGFLIGDTRELAAHDAENLRRTGLAHFIAVSGSNVAVFLMGWWIVTAPLAVHPRVRSVVGLVGLGIFIVATRWEASVVRASTMAAIPLLGGLVGIPVDPWMALGAAVTALLLVSADLLGSVGFQLSVAATAGVLIGSKLAAGRRPKWLWTPLIITVCAQLAVAPIILFVFGTMPLLAPLANLVVAPIVAAATIVGGLTLVSSWFAPIASMLAGLILAVADAAASGPQLGAAGVAVATGVGALVVARVSRPLGVAVALVIALGAASHAESWPNVPVVAVLNIGQGDAIVLMDPSGAAMLIDGGPDPAVTDRALRRHHVERIDVVVATHGDADHVGGLVEVIASRDVGELWVSRFAAPSDLLQGVIDEAARRNVEVRRVGAGERTTIGSIEIDVVSPARRFASPNDGSIVIVARSERSALLPGDIEAIGQAELPMLRPYVMVVPHHGSATTDPQWLARTLGEVAVLSYGVNRYGHPAPSTVAVLDASGAAVHETFEEGDVVVPLVSSPPRR